METAVRAEGDDVKEEVQSKKVDAAADEGVAGTNRHRRCDCPNHPFAVTTAREGKKGVENAEACGGCLCVVCGCSAESCLFWISQGHCNANEKDSFWKLAKHFHQDPTLSYSSLLKGLTLNSADNLALESKKWYVEVLLAFRKYHEGDETDCGLVKHSFQHVINIIQSAVTCIISRIAQVLDSRGPCAIFAVLDGVTTGLVVSTWRPSKTADSRHIWHGGTGKAYRAILHKLEEYWVLTLVSASAASALAPDSWAAFLGVISARLSHLSALAVLEICPDPAEQREADVEEDVPLSQAMMASKRDWNAPIVVSILEGTCQDVNEREAAVLQRARLHVLERAQRWRKAYHYAIFHGHFSRSLSYMVRAGRHHEILHIMKDRARSMSSKCVSVCRELASLGDLNFAYRIGMFCAFRRDLLECSVGTATASETDDLGYDRLPCLQWLIKSLRDKMEATEWEQRRASPIVGSGIATVREACRAWALNLIAEDADMCTELQRQLPMSSADAPFSFEFCTLERVAALGAVASRDLQMTCATAFLHSGDVTGTMSVILGAGSECYALVAWALRELVPRSGFEALEPIVSSLQSNAGQIPISDMMEIASALLATRRPREAIAWAKAAQRRGLPCENGQEGSLAFQDRREYRPCDLQRFVESAMQAGDVEEAAILAQIQMWWEPSWGRLEALRDLVSPQLHALRVQQLQSLVRNDECCDPALRFEVMVRGNKLRMATDVLAAIAQADRARGIAALQKALENLGQECVRASGIIEVAWTWISEELQRNELDDLEGILPWFAPTYHAEILRAYNQRVDDAASTLSDSDSDRCSSAVWRCHGS